MIKLIKLFSVTLIALTLIACNSGNSSSEKLSITPSVTELIATQNTMIEPITITVLSGGEVDSYSITPVISAGLSFSTTTGTIEGTPTTVATRTEYVITAMSATDIDAVGVAITINPSTPTISANPSSLIATVGIAIDPITINSTGGAVDSYSITPAITNGLAFNTATGAISGTPLAVATTATYTITATNVTGTSTATVNITINPSAPIIANGTDQTVVVDTAIIDITFTNTGGAITMCSSIGTALPTGLSVALSGGNCVISGTPSVTQTETEYTIAARNVTGTSTATVNITINPLPATIQGSAKFRSGQRGDSLQDEPASVKIFKRNTDASYELQSFSTSPTVDVSTGVVSFLTHQEQGRLERDSFYLYQVNSIIGYDDNEGNLLTNTVTTRAFVKGSTVQTLGNEAIFSVSFASEIAYDLMAKELTNPNLMPADIDTLIGTTTGQVIAENTNTDGVINILDIITFDPILANDDKFTQKYQDNKNAILTNLNNGGTALFGIETFRDSFAQGEFFPTATATTLGDIAISNDGNTAFITEFDNNGEFSLYFVNIEDLTNPVERTHPAAYKSDAVAMTITGGPLSAAASVTLSADGRRAFIAGYQSGLEIIDVVTDPTPDIKRYTGNYSNGNNNNNNNLENVSISDNPDTIYLSGSAAGLEILNIANPDPEVLGTYVPATAEVIDAVILTNDSSITAYIANGRYGFEIVDVSNPANPVLLGGPVDLSGSATSIALSPDGNTAYVTTNAVVTTNVGTSIPSLHIIDISTPSTPAIISSISTTDSTDVVLSKEGNVVFVADRTSGVRVINVNNPKNPTLAGIYSTRKDTDHRLIGAIGVTLSPDGNTLFVASGVLPLTNILSDSRGQGNMQIIDVSVFN